MALSAKLAQRFSSTTRKRGQDYYRQQRVEIQRGSDFEVEACVSGSKTYDVDLNWSHGKLSVWCECPYFADSGFPCKHLWATILAAEAQGYLSAAAAAGNVTLECDFVDGDTRFDDRGPRAPLIALRASAGVPRPAAPKPPVWRQQVREILNSRQVAGPRDGWPARREILYVVDVPSSLTRAGLILSLQSRDRRADGSWKQERTLSLKREQLTQLPLLEDREILSALAGAKQYYAYGYLDSYERVPESLLMP